jgi:hypothetical protein
VKMTLEKLALLLSGDLNGNWLNIHGPGHSKGDRSLGVLFDSSEPGGFRVHSLADDDLPLCRNHVLKLLKKVASGDAIEIEMQETSANHFEQQRRIASALVIWQEAQP